MAPQISREATVAVVAGTVVVAAAAVAVVYNERTREVSSSAYASLSSGASTAAAKASDALTATKSAALSGYEATRSAAASGLEAARSAAASGYAAVSSSISSAVNRASSQLRMKKVKSFPLLDELADDVAAAADTVKAKVSRKSPKKGKKAQALEKASVPINATATA